MQTAGRGVGDAAELAARVQLRHDQLDAGQAGLGLDVDRDAAAVVADLHRAVGVQVDVDAGTVTAERLIDGVVDDLPQAVHEAAAVGGPDVHPGPLADGLESFEHRQVPRGVPVRVLSGDGGGGQRLCSSGVGRAAAEYPSAPTLRGLARRPVRPPSPGGGDHEADQIGGIHRREGVLRSTRPYGSAMPNTIVATDLRKRYGDVRAVDGVTLAIEEGEFFGILGPNGAGKTTTLEIIEGLRQAGRAARSPSSGGPRGRAIRGCCRGSASSSRPPPSSSGSPRESSCGPSVRCTGCRTARPTRCWRRSA